MARFYDELRDIFKSEINRLNEFEVLNNNDISNYLTTKNPNDQTQEMKEPRSM